MIKKMIVTKKFEFSNVLSLKIQNAAWFLIFFNAFQLIFYDYKYKILQYFLSTTTASDENHIYHLTF